MGLENTVVLRTFTSETSAELAASQLRSCGIDCELQADDCGGMLPPLQSSTGVRLLVAQKDAADAKRILDEWSVAPPLVAWPPGAAGLTDSTEPRTGTLPIFWSARWQES